MDFRTVIRKINSGNVIDVTAGLHEIVSECTSIRGDKRNPMQENSLLKQYLVSSPNCSELFHIWNDIRGDYNSAALQILYPVIAEVIRYGDDTLKKNLCIQILKKESVDLMGALVTEDMQMINSACTLLKAIADVGAAAVQLCNQKIPLSSIKNLPDLIHNTKTRYRCVRWIEAIIRNDPEISGKQVLLRGDVMMALVDNIYKDGDFLMGDIISLFTVYVLPNPDISLKLKQGFFSWSTLNGCLGACRSTPSKETLQQFILNLFSTGSTAIYGPLPQLSFTSPVPSMAYRVLTSLSPMKSEFDRRLYITVIMSHPQFLPLLFAAQTDSSTDAVDSYVVGGSETSGSKNKTLLTWMLEPRESSYWYATVDFLVELLKQPLALPEEAKTLAESNPSLLLDTVKMWLFPVVLNKSLFNKGLITTSAGVLHKTLELLYSVASRLQSVGVFIYGSVDKASHFFSHFAYVLPGSDVLSQTFKKLVMCVLRGEAICSHRQTKSEKGEDGFVLNVVAHEMEEESDETEEGEEVTEGLLQELCVYLHMQMALYHSLISQLRIDPLVLFSPRDDGSILLLSGPTELSVALLDTLLLLLSSDFSSDAQTLVVGKGELKPLMFLLFYVGKGLGDDVVKSKVYDVIFEMLKVTAQIFTDIPHPREFMYLLFALLTPAVVEYLYDVTQDLVRNRLKFLSWNNTCNLQIPLFVIALLFTATKTKAVDVVSYFYMMISLLTVANPSILRHVVALFECYVKQTEKTGEMEIEDESSGKPEFLACQMSDDMIQCLRLYIKFWSRDIEPIGIRPVAELEITEIIGKLVSSKGAQITTLFHTLIWYDITQPQLYEVVNGINDCDDFIQNVVLLLFMFVPLRCENLDVISSWRVVLDALRGRNYCHAMKAIIMMCALRTAESDVLNCEQLEAVICGPLAFYTLFCDVICSVDDLICGNLLESLLTMSSDKDVMSLVSYILNDKVMRCMWTHDSSAICCKVIIRRMHIINTSIPTLDTLKREIASILVTSLNTSFSVTCLVFLQESLFLEERSAVIRFILQHSDDTVIAKQLQETSCRWTVPLDPSLLRELLDKVVTTQNNLPIELLLEGFDQILREKRDGSVESISMLLSLIPESILPICVQRSGNTVYIAFLSLIMKLLPVMHVPFIQILFRNQMNDAYTTNFDTFAQLITECMGHSAYQHEMSRDYLLQVLGKTSFYVDLVVRACSNRCDKTVFACITSVARYNVLELAMMSLDCEQLCKDAFSCPGVTVYQLQSLMLVLSLAGIASDRTTSLLLLKTIQAVGKMWAKEGLFSETSQTGDSADFCEFLLTTCETHSSNLVKVVTKQPATIAKFVRLLLKNRLADWRSLALLRLILEAELTGGLPNEELSVETVCTLLLSHSAFNTMIGRVRQQCVCTDDDKLRKTWMEYSENSHLFSVHFLRLIQYLISQKSTVCSVTLFYQLLSLYSCSYSPEDCILRSIFRDLHNAHLFTLDSTAYLFGRFAPVTSTEAVQTPSGWLLEAVSGVRLRKSVEAFPASALEIKEEKMEEEEDTLNHMDDVVNEEEEEEEEEEKNRMQMEEEPKVSSRRDSVISEGDISKDNEVEDDQFNPNLDCVEYLLSHTVSFCIPSTRDAVLIIDPTFYLPMLHYYLNLPTVEIRDFVSHGVVGYLFACLTCDDIVIRQCASCLLQRVYEHVIDSDFFGQQQVRLVLLKLQNSMSSPCIRLTAVMASFLNEALGIMLRPGNALYNQMNRFFLSHASFSLNDTPLFHHLFLSDSEDYKQLRAWCLRYLLRGIRSIRDYALLTRRHILSQIQTFACSSLCDPYTQKLCIAIILRLSEIPAVAPILYHNVGILPWLIVFLSETRIRSVTYAAMCVLENVVNGCCNETNEVMFELDCLMILGKFIEIGESGDDDNRDGDVNKILLPCMKLYEMIVSRFCKNVGTEELEGNGEMGVSELKTQFVRVLMQLLSAMQKLQKEREVVCTSSVLSGIELSNDDFFLLCEPELMSRMKCFDCGCEILKHLKSEIPFSTEQFRNCEHLFDSLFI